MQFASALVEYLIAGIIGLLWLFPLLHALLSKNLPINFEITEGSVVLLLPVAYVLGMYIDSTSSFLIRALRLRKMKLPLWIKKVVDILFGKPYEGVYKRTITVLAKSPDLLAQTMLTYVSRDRIARCMTLNSAIGFMVSVFLKPCLIQLHILLVVAFFWSYATWIRLVRLSSKFKDQAYNIIHLDEDSELTTIDDLPVDEER